MFRYSNPPAIPRLFWPKRRAQTPFDRLSSQGKRNQREDHLPASAPATKTIMPRGLSWIPPGEPVEITTRTLESRRMLLVTPQFRCQAIGTLARAAERYRVRIHAVLKLRPEKMKWSPKPHSSRCFGRRRMRFRWRWRLLGRGRRFCRFGDLGRLDSNRLMVDGEPILIFPIIHRLIRWGY